MASGRSQETATTFCLFIKPLIDIRAATRGILATPHWIRPFRPSHDQETQRKEIWRLRQEEQFMRVPAQKQSSLPLPQQASLNLARSSAKPLPAGHLVHPIRPLDSNALVADVTAGDAAAGELTRAGELRRAVRCCECRKWVARILRSSRSLRPCRARDSRARCCRALPCSARTICA